MKTKKLLKALGVVLAAVALVVVSVLGTMAWLTDTKTVKNTITVGNVEITLTEPNAPEDGKYENLIPGLTYEKDPTIAVTSTSANCYLRAKVEINLADKWDGTFANSITLGDGWEIYGAPVAGSAQNTLVYEIRYVGTSEDAGADIVTKTTELDPIFTHFTVPGTWTNDTVSAQTPATITVEAHAIQADGFAADAENEKTAADVAWEAFDE